MTDVNTEIARRLFLFMSKTRKWFKQHMLSHPGGKRFGCVGDEGCHGKTGNEKHGGENPFTEARFHLLHIIAERQPLKMSELSKLHHVTKGSLTVTLNKLVEDGYVERVSQPEDRRVVMVRLTPSGESYLHKAHEMMVARMSKAFEGMPAEKKEKMAALLDELNRILE